MEFLIKPKGKFNIGLQELVEYKELFYFFTWRDIKVKYKQTAFGFLWAVLQPLFMTLVFSFFLGSSIKQQSDLLMPYPIFALSGMLLWIAFSNGLSNASNSMVNNANIIKKIYFPRLIIPISAILVALFDFFISLFVFFIFCWIYKTSLKWEAILFMPLSVLMVSFAAIGGGTFLAAINIKYRDVRYAIPFFLQALLFVTPVLYPVNFAKNEVIQLLLKLNPISGPLEILRASFYNQGINIETVLLSAFTSGILFITGVVYFRKTESYFADLA
jgi:lipopolysaccharide transport system permease protein